MSKEIDFQSPSVRLPGLDNLRALMMWLGIVLHVCVIYVAGEPVLPWRDDQRTRLADLLMAFIHAFRMPVFFILAGFFVAMLLQARGARGLAAHRLRRLALPFAVFWPVIYLLNGIAALAFMHLMARGTWGLDMALRPRGPTIPDGPSTGHLWFLWMLLWFSLATALLAGLQRRRAVALWHHAATLLQWLGASWWGWIVLTLPLVLAGWTYPRGLIAPSGLFLPRWQEWLHNGVFYAFGLALFHHQWDLFALFQRRWKAHAAAGLVLFLATGALIERRPDAAVWIALAYNACSWLWSFAAIGMALRMLPRRSALLAYLADSSYWVYLVHMPLTIVFGALLFGLPWPALAKIGINIAATTALCLASYQLFVRHTPVSMLLNGRRHVRKPQGVLAHANP
jgi:peptidoglycan/LPS O-acetylase OafA/YrhL